MKEVDRAGFESLVAARTPALLRTAYLLTGDSHLAEDLLQTAYARAYSRWGQLREPQAGEAYVRRVLATQAVSWRRRLWRGERPTERLPEAVAESEIARADQRDVLRRALATLPPAQRAVVVLRFYDDMSEAQVAAVLDVPVGTVKSRANRALAALRQYGVRLTPEEVS